MSRLLDREDLHAKGIKYSAVQLWRKVKEGSFPKPVKLSSPDCVRIEPARSSDAGTPARNTNPHKE